MIDTPNPAGQLCEWACATSYEDLPADVLKETVNVLYDTVGGMIACSRLPTCLPVVEMVAAMGGNQQCSVIGHPLKTMAAYAALANGTIAQGDEVDPSGRGGSGHFAAVTVPAAIGLGQYTKASGKQFLRALALGSEVAARIACVLMEMYEYREELFQRSIISAPMGVAVLGGILLNLNAEQMEHAVALAGYHAGGLTSFFHDDTHQSKSLQYGMAAHGGVVAALLAQRGFHGPPRILTCEYGFFDAFTGYPALGNQVVTDLGKTYRIREVAYKPYPVGGGDQAPLHGFLQLIKANKLKADDIEGVEVTVSRHTFLVATSLKHPAVHLATMLSLAAIFGDVNFEHIHEARYYEDPRIEAFSKRVKVLPDAGMGGRREAKVEVRTRDGKVLTQQLRFPQVDEAFLQRKFRYLAGLRLNENRVLDIEGKIKGIAAVADVTPLFEELELAD